MKEICIRENVNKKKRKRKREKKKRNKQHIKCKQLAQIIQLGNMKAWNLGNNHHICQFSLNFTFIPIILHQINMAEDSITLLTHKAKYVPSNVYWEIWEKHLENITSSTEQLQRRQSKIKSSNLIRNEKTMKFDS